MHCVSSEISGTKTKFTLFNNTQPTVEFAADSLTEENLYKNLLLNMLSNLRNSDRCPSRSYPLLSGVVDIIAYYSDYYQFDQLPLTMGIPSSSNIHEYNKLLNKDESKLDHMADIHEKFTKGTTLTEEEQKLYQNFKEKIKDAIIIPTSPVEISGRLFLDKNLLLRKGKKIEEVTTFEGLNFLNVFQQRDSRGIYRFMGTPADEISALINNHKLLDSGLQRLSDMKKVKKLKLDLILSIYSSKLVNYLSLFKTETAMQAIYPNIYKHLLEEIQTCNTWTNKFASYATSGWRVYGEISMIMSVFVFIYRATCGQRRHQD